MTADPEVDELLNLIKNVNQFSDIKSCSKSKMYRRQWVTSLNFLLPIILLGMAHGHSSILIQDLLPQKSDNSQNNFKIENGEFFNRPKITIESLDDQSWVVSLMVLCMCPGCWILASFGPVFGRKKMLITSVGMFLISWMIIAFASNIYFILIGRSFAGLCSGFIMGLASAYQGECCIPKLRATLNAGLTVCFSLGIGLSHTLGIWFHWRTVAVFAGLICVVTLFLNYFVPESPVWLIRKKKFHEALRSWTYLRGIRDLDELKSMHISSLQNNSTEDNEKKPRLTRIYSNNFLKPLGILLIIFTVSQMSGMGAVIHYCIQMISNIAGSDRAYLPTVILDTFRFGSSITLSIVTKHYSTRALTLFSAFSTSFFLIFLSFSIFINMWAPWFSLVLLFAYELVVVMGLSSLPWAFCGELFPASYKEIGIGVTSSYNFFLFFLVLKINPYLMLNFQPWGTFLFYGIFTSVGAIVLYFILPNTKNKSLKDIELMFMKNTNV